MFKKVVVTGAAGFIGSTIARRLVELGTTQVVGVDRISNYYDELQKRRNIASWLSDPHSLVEVDLCDANLPELLEGVDVVFHQAGQPGVRPSWGDSFDTYLRDNVHATQKLLEAIKSSAPRCRLVYASSSSVYGDAESYPTSEDVAPKPVSPYGVTKLAAEHLANLYAKNFGLSTVSLRYFTVYGPGQRPDMAFTKFCTAAVRGAEIEIYGTGAQIRDFTYIDDVVDANIKAATSTVPPGLVVNIAGGTSTSLNNCVDMIAKLSGTEVRRIMSDSATGDVYQTGGSTERAFRYLGWSAKTSIEEGLARQMSWVKEIESGRHERTNRAIVPAFPGTK
jgi:nucleoside-diphosphate-sugar epimerase